MWRNPSVSGGASRYQARAWYREALALPPRLSGYSVAFKLLAF